MDPVKNFAKVTVSIPYDNIATSILLNSGDGAKLPNPSTDGAFNLIWWNSTNYPDPSDDPNKEIVRCTVRSTDTLTITRAQEGTSATTKNTSGKTYKMILALTAKTVDDIQTDAQSKVNTHASLTTAVHGVGGNTVDSVEARNSAISAHASSTATHGVTGVIVGTTDSQVLTNKVIYDNSNYVISEGIKHSTGWVNVYAAAAPSSGQVLKATDSTTATWQSTVFTKGGTLVNIAGIPNAALNVITWLAPYACTVTAVKGYRVGGTGATINARKNASLNHLASSLSLTSADTWMDGGSVQNTAYATNDKLEIMIVSTAGTVTQIGIQVNYTTP